MALKYVMVQQPDAIFPVLFPEAFTHRVVAADLGLQEMGTIRSAGFVRLLPGEVSRLEASGYSKSLQLGPHPEDGRIITGWLAASPSGSHCGGQSMLML